MTPDEYVTAVETRLVAGGVQIGHVPIGGLDTLIGYRSQFKMQWMATKLHLFTVVGTTPLTVNADGLRGFSMQALDFAEREKGGMKGLQVGVAAIPILVSEHVTRDAVTLATNDIIKRFSAFAWPVVVDLTARKAYSHQGRVMIGGIYANWMRGQIELALPDFK
jgi:hypothetical protein